MAIVRRGWHKGKGMVSQHFIQLSHLSAKTAPPHEGAKSQVRDSSACFERKDNRQCVNIANVGVV